ncbi:AI-2E family transporter [Albimonas sp. CAU 1670]|uniref:AI-2E family transporter n=1 Tax=Albimonas sp. CAU 1670 TaxID=3032599 RepID=UPI0023DA9B36|nr:AI-2E family transporter [Albimonas sp. CAU 1670]MDF2232300.1 AI-2E family transporter [Albimonas sp. CAU 1670]
MFRIGQTLASGPFFALAFVVLCAWTLAATSEYAAPVALSLLAWFLINGLTSAMMRNRFLGRASRGVVRVIAVTLLFGALLIAVQGVVLSLSSLTEDLTLYGNPLFLRAWYWLNGQGLSDHLTKEALFERFAGEGGLTAMLDMARSAVSDASLIFLYTVFLLTDDRFFQRKLRNLVNDQTNLARLQGILDEIGHETGRYLWLMTLVSAGVGVLTWATCWALEIKGAALWGFVAFALNYIPTIGSLLGVAVPAAFGILTTGDPGTVMLLCLALGVIQFIAGNVVVPRMMGDQLNLSTFVILISLVAWGAIWGATGMFLAVPIMVVMVMIFAKFETTRPIAILLSKTGEVPRPEWMAPDRELHVDPETGEVTRREVVIPASVAVTAAAAPRAVTDAGPSLHRAGAEHAPAPSAAGPAPQEPAGGTDDDADAGESPPAPRSETG